MEGVEFLKTKEILLFETKIVGLEDIMLGKRSQMQKDKHCMSSYVSGI